MKPGPAPARDNSSAWLALIMAAAIILVTPATIRGQQVQAPAASSPAATAVPAPGDTHGLGSFVGIAMVSIGILMILSVAARVLIRPRRTKKPYYPPVLFDRLDQGGIARLQEKINNVTSMRPPVYLYERTEPETNLVFDEPAEETEIEEQSVDERFPVHAAAASDDTTDEI